MRIPIQYALTYPHRAPGPAPRLDVRTVPGLTFEAPDETRFPALAVARDAGRRGPWATAALIAADEVAVRRFLDGSLGFGAIPSLVAGAVERFGSGAGEPGVDDLVALDAAVTGWADRVPAGEL
jgi:1-deoxy-D-xylulose-5-phosphate reductoisomerase